MVNATQGYLLVSHTTKVNKKKKKIEITKSRNIFTRLQVELLVTID